ncbi:MAG: ABC transporter ATP-binding protein [Coriobacteriales bacterium]|jgi:ABC-2 type transport system ATP-binding protein/lipopolysaccharide transport system ATP-binding protein|nr:ABC transporter ATP-binding protein [Coriobacteriales bacterium]
MSSVITVKHLTMKYVVTKDRADSVKEYLIRYLKRQLTRDEFIALDDISFKVGKGEVVGIVGLNGSGKSTLLKLISGVLKPTSGTVERVGSVAPLIELGAGFDDDLTARENIYLNGAVMGFSHREMAKKYDAIISFAELEKFQDRALKTFSSGMRARLGFSVATATKPEVLIVDEILGVGDFLFKEKSEARIKELMAGGTTVLLVSHTIKQIRELCSRALWLDEGHLLMDGATREVCDAYEAGAGAL